MRYTQGKYLITEKKTIAKGMFDLTILCPEIAEIAQAGQFVHAAAEGFLLRRPISICDISREKGTIRILFEARGAGTEKLSQSNSGDFIDLIAPLGRGFKLLDPAKKAICIGGGIGTPPMLAVAKHYGKNAMVISGFRTAGLTILQEDYAAAGAQTILCTDDGTAGIKGRVTEGLLSCLAQGKPDVIYACGPTVMLKAVTELAIKNDIFCQVSLEQRMGCGVGACLVCACKIKRGNDEYYAHVCQDGPVFDCKEVRFDG
ncbi:MAG: dihydroorotate dehydrogenase electron transfer subunit [Oscillospiraceae bacterium]